MLSLLLRRAIYAIIFGIVSVIASRYIGIPLGGLIQGTSQVPDPRSAQGRDQAPFPGTDQGPGRDRDPRYENDSYQGRRQQECEKDPERRQEIDALRQRQAIRRSRYDNFPDLRRHQYQEWEERRRHRYEERAKWRDFERPERRGDYQNGRFHRSDY